MDCPHATRLFQQHHHTITRPSGHARVGGLLGGSGFRGSVKATPFSPRLQRIRAVSAALEIRLEKPRRSEGPGPGVNRLFSCSESCGLQISGINDVTPSHIRPVARLKSARVQETEWLDILVQCLTVSREAMESVLKRGARAS